MKDILIEKYRPSKLDEVVGQDKIVKKLKDYVADKNMPHLLFSGAPGCITGDSVVFTDKGLITIKELYEERNKKKMSDIKVACSDGKGGVEFKNIEEYHNLKGKDIIKLTTKYGFELKCTPEHKVVSLDKHAILGYIESKDLKFGDNIPIFCGANCFGNNVRMRWDEGQTNLFEEFELPDIMKTGVIERGYDKCSYPYIMNQELAEFLGYFVSEGNVKYDGYSVIITNIDDKINQRVEYLTKKLFGHNSEITPDYGKNRERGRKVSSVGLASFLTKLGLNVKSKYKEVPREILRSSKESYVAFLKALFDGDGCASISANSVIYGSMSKKLCSQTQLMLLNLGIFSNLYESDAYNSDSEIYDKKYSIIATGDNVLKFKKIVGFDLEYRKNNLSEICNTVDDEKYKRNCYKRTLCSVNKLIETIYTEFKRLSQLKCIYKDVILEEEINRIYMNVDEALRDRNTSARNIQRYINSKRHVSKEYLYITLLAMKECSHMDEYKYLMRLYNLNVEYDEIKSIEYGKEDVYDLSIEDIHHYIANGFIVHNSGKTTSAICLAKELYGIGWKADFKELNASVSKTTPILIRIDGNRIECVDFQYLDKYYNENIKNLEVLTVGNDLKVKWSKVTKLIRHKVEKIIRILFEGGRIELTGNHSVIVFNEEGELVSKSAGCLDVGDYLISFCTNLEDNNVIEETKSLVNLDINTSWLYGMYRSEGCLSKNHVILTLGSHEHEYIKRIRNIAENRIGVNTSETLCGSGFSKLVGECDRLSGNQVKLFSKNIVPFFRNMFYERHCIEHSAHTKRVPFFIFGQKLENRLSYLKGEYEGDGCNIRDGCNIYGNDGYMYNDNFRVTSVSRNSLVDIAWLGRTSKLHTSVYPEDNVVHLLTGSFKSELIPADLVINILSKLPKNILDYNWRYDLRHQLYDTVNRKKNERVTKDTLYGVMNHIKQPKFEDTLFAYLGGIKIQESKENYLVNRLRTILNGDLHAVEIKKIEVIEYNDFVYDVSVPENQMFFAGDIPLLLHNSDERGIDVIRGVVKDFAGVESISDIGFKIILLDEADSLTKDAQSALRRTMEQYSSSCRFILTCNYSSSIIEPIQSRCAVFRFKRLSNGDIIKRCKYICGLEEIRIEDDALEAIAFVSEGDLRKSIGILDSVSYSGREVVKVCDIYDITGAVEPVILRDIIKKALSREFFAALLMVEKVILDGLSGVDILKGMVKEVLNMNIEDRLKVDIIERIGEAEFRISEGANELIQLKWLIASMVKLGSLV